MKCRALLPCLLFIFSLSGLSRAVEPSTAPVLRIEAGMHTAMINRISADATGRLVLTASDDKTARLWELPSGRLLRVLRPPLGEGNVGKLYACALSPDGTLAAVGGWTSMDPVGAENCSVYLFDTATGRMVRQLSGMPDVALDIAFSPQGRYLAATLFAGKGLRVWEAATGREAGRDTEYGESHSYGVDWQGEERLVTTCYDGKVRLYRLAATAGGSKLSLLKKSTVKGGKEPFSARFSPDGRQIAVGFAHATAVAVVDSNDLSFVFSPDGAGVDNGDLSCVTWTDNGATLAAAGEWTRGGENIIRQWPEAGRGRPRDTAAARNTIADLRPLPGGGVLFSSIMPAWGVLPGAGMPRPQIPAGAGSAPLPIVGAGPLADFRDLDASFRLSADGNVVAFAYEKSGQGLARFSVSDGQLDLLKDGAVPPDLQGPRREGLRVTDWKDGTAPKLAGKALPLILHEKFYSLAISSDASSFLLGTEWLVRHTTAKGVELWKVPVPAPALAVHLVDGNRLVVAAYGDGTIRWHRADNGQELLAFLPHADRKRWVLWATEYRQVETDRPSLGADWNLESGEKYVLRNVQPDSPATRAGLQEGDRFVDYRDKQSEPNLKKIGGRVRLVVERQGKKINVEAVIGAERENQVQAVYYDCSPGAEELIGWHVNRGLNQAADFHPAAKFREQFYRPDVIRRVLGKRNVPAALKEANEGLGRKAQVAPRVEEVVAKMQPPVVELNVGGGRGEATAPAGASSFTVRYQVRRGGQEAVTRMRVLVDGRPVEIAAAVPASDTAEASAEVPLPPRDCIVAVLAENRFAVSEPATLRVLRAGAAERPSSAADSPPPAMRPKLYLLAAGISDYVNNDQLDDLHFAAKDARDFTAAFQRQEGGLYQKVETRVLTDKDATAAAIKDGLDWIRQETTAKDVAVIFLSGHGENDEELRYFFCAQDYDKKRRSSTGVSFEEIQRSVRAIPGKVLFFIDSCHAGNALGKMFAAKSAGAQVNVTRMINELSDAENGAVVFTSSTGRQLSLELAQEKNGAFTKAIVEGLDGKADLRNNGRITVSALEFFLAERVKELTEGQQTPTVAKPQTVPDFPIAVKR